MGGRTWKHKMLPGLAAVTLLGVLALPAFAQRQKAIPLNAALTENCFVDPSKGLIGCETDIGNLGSSPKYLYSLRSDGLDPFYSPSNLVQSEILSNRTVYTLDTLDTLVNGLVDLSSTRYVKMHFYFPPDIQKLDTKTGLLMPRIPDCWANSTTNTSDQNEAVNWSVFTSSVAFADMQQGTSYPGFSRLDFNVRDTIASCFTQVFRFWLRWPNVTITRLNNTASGKRVWEVTTPTTPSSEASLEGQGGKKGQTQAYGDFRVPFKLTLTEP